MVNEAINTGTVVCTLLKGNVAHLEALSSEGQKVALPKRFTRH